MGPKKRGRKKVITEGKDPQVAKSKEPDSKRPRRTCRTNESHVKFTKMPTFTTSLNDSNKNHPDSEDFFPLSQAGKLIPTFGKKTKKPKELSSESKGRVILENNEATTSKDINYTGTSNIYAYVANNDKSTTKTNLDKIDNKTIINSDIEKLKIDRDGVVDECPISKDSHLSAIIDDIVDNLSEEALKTIDEADIGDKDQNNTSQINDDERSLINEKNLAVDKVPLDGENMKIPIDDKNVSNNDSLSMAHPVCVKESGYNVSLCKDKAIDGDDETKDGNATGCAMTRNNNAKCVNIDSTYHNDIKDTNKEQVEDQVEKYIPNPEESNKDNPQDGDLKQNANIHCRDIVQYVNVLTSVPTMDTAHSKATNLRVSESEERDTGVTTVSNITNHSITRDTTKLELAQLPIKMKPTENNKSECENIITDDDKANITQGQTNIDLSKSLIKEVVKSDSIVKPPDSPREEDNTSKLHVPTTIEDCDTLNETTPKCSRLSKPKEPHMELTTEGAKSNSVTFDSQDFMDITDSQLCDLDEDMLISSRIDDSSTSTSKQTSDSLTTTGAHHSVDLGPPQFSTTSSTGLTHNLRCTPTPATVAPTKAHPPQGNFQQEASLQVDAKTTRELKNLTTELMRLNVLLTKTQRDIDIFEKQRQIKKQRQLEKVQQW